MSRSVGGDWEGARPGPPALRSREDGVFAWAVGRTPWGADLADRVIDVRDSGGGDFWAVLRRRRLGIASVFVVTAAATAAWTYTTRPMYTATATVRIEKDEPRVLTFDQVTKETDPLPDSLVTQQRMLQSRALAKRVIAKLGVADHPEFRDDRESEGWLDRVPTQLRTALAAWLPSPPAAPPAPTADLALESPLSRAFESRLSVNPVRGSRLVKVSFESHDPVLAARVANALGDTFVARTHELRVDTGRYASTFLDKQLLEARNRLEEAEQKLNAFLKANGINFVSPATMMGRGNVGGGTERQDLITQQLATLSDALIKARNDRIAKESLVQQVDGQDKDVDSLPAVLQSPLIVKLKGDLGGYEAEYKRLSQIFRPEYPRMRQLEQSIGELRAHIQAEVGRVVKGLQADHRAALQNERQIEQAMVQQRDEALKLGDRMVAYNILRRDVDANRDLYTALLTRLKETRISADLLTSPISIVDRAEVPLMPTRPRKALNLLLGSVVGLLAGIGLAFLSERLDRRIRNADEVERVLGVPSLGLVPQAYRLGSPYSRRALDVGGGRWGRRLPCALVTHLDTASPFAECFRDLRTSILYSTPGRPPKTVLVTSLQPGDGKTSLAVNLAVSIAQIGSGDVCVVDANLRNAKLHTILSVSRDPGLSTVLAGRTDVGAALHSTSIPGLWLVPGGRRPRNPAELLASRRLEHALEQLGERFQHIIVDSPPLLAVSDALNMAPRLEGVVLVLRHRHASREEAQAAIQRLWYVRANLLGVVVNGVDGPATRRRGVYPTEPAPDADDDDERDDA